MEELGMERCRRIVDFVTTAAAADGGSPVAVAVCDREGFLVALQKMDGTPTRVAYLARRKAYTAARMQAATGDFHARLAREQLDIRWFCDERLTPLPGGAPIFGDGGRVIGSVGISGRPSADDQELANRAAALK